MDLVTIHIVNIKNNDVDVKYTFDRQSDMESFVRFYHQSHQYLSSDKYAWVLHDDGMSNKAFNLTGDQFTKDFPDGAKDGALLDAWIEKNLAPSLAVVKQPWKNG